MATEKPAAQDNGLTLAAAALGVRHDIRPGSPAPIPVWQNLSAIVPWLDRACVAAAKPPHHAAKASEWLLDNEFHVRRAVLQVAEDMPLAFYRRLQSLAAPEFKGIPRIVSVAHGLLDVMHMHIEPAAIRDFIAAYQYDRPLTIAELWAFPAMLRLACLERLILAFSELVPEIVPPFEATPGVAPHEALDATESVSRAISALISISNSSWKEFFEQVSLVEDILRNDPGGVYPKMDFDTRDRYRKAVEEIALGARTSEIAVAETALRLAAKHSGDLRRGHVGCWLVAEGRRDIEQAVGFRSKPVTSFRRWIIAHPGVSYVTALTGFGLGALAVPVVLFILFEADIVTLMAGLVLALMPATIIGITITHWAVTQFVPPRVLPKIDLEPCLTPGHEAVVVMPVILRTADEVGPMLERLETHWLSNPEPLIHIALLTDLADAATERTPEDTLIEKALVAGIQHLNALYPEQRPFILLHRARRWNAGEGCWMGWERKRGKLEEFSAFILDGRPDAFTVREGDLDALANIKSVVTLDADTIASPGGINRLLGALAHPLNRVEFDPGSGKPRRGYTFIQPRVEISPNAGGRSLFTRLYTGDTAIDIYSRAVSDVYQDLFGDGIFTGKGAYDVEAFHRCLHGCVPENAILSHDMFEGLHARAALANDIVFYEDFPADYLAYARRAHRWIRGDWQLLPWLARSVPVRGGTYTATSLSPLDRWKIADNLRRSLIPPSLVAFATAGWLGLPDQALLWTALAIAAPGAYLFTDLVTSLARGRRRGAARSTLHKLSDHSGRWVLAIVFMAYESIQAVEAIVRTLWRIYVSRRRMLQWTSAAHSASQTGHDHTELWTEMASAPAFATAAAATLAAVSPASLPGALPLLVLWFISPAIAWLISRPKRMVVETLGAKDRKFLRLIARRTWLFFETFAGPGENWLPPDNYQIPPHEEIAHRSSPTNVGMLFLSSLTAWDLGHVGLRDLAARTSCVLDSLDRLETHAGHTLNWFDTKTLHSLEPRYVSTVDSGNLAASLLTLREGCLEACRGPAMSPVLWNGLEDVLQLLREAISDLPIPHSRKLADQLDAILDRLPDIRDTPEKWRTELVGISTGSWQEVNSGVAEALGQTPAIDPREIHLWLERVDHHLTSMRRDLDALEPWHSLAATPPVGSKKATALIAALPLPDMTLDERAIKIGRLQKSLAELAPSDPKVLEWTRQMARALDQGADFSMKLTENLVNIARRASERAFGMNFQSLYDDETRTFYIGYNLSSDRMDPHHYDLLASEARLASYLAISKRDVPVDHWFHLGRPIATAGRSLITLSWNGSMFEYLMPTLLLPSDSSRLLGQSERAAVAAQRLYAQNLGLPWGVSESGYASRDSMHRYQYQAFGTPGIGLKRGLSDDYVVTPYASALALALAPAAAVDNLRALEKLGLRGRYGFYEAADFTPDRRPPQGGFTPVLAYMAHHQGMIAAAIGNALNANRLVTRFTREPHIRATELLLQERVPWEFPPEQATEDVSTIPDLSGMPTPALHSWNPAGEPAPQLHLLGNGSLACWISDNGGGALWWRGQSLTRWTGDAVFRGGDSRIYLSDPDRGTILSLGERVTDRPTERIFHAHKAEFHERVDGLSISLEIAIAPGDDIEVRRIIVSNESNDTRQIDLTSYAEVILAAAGDHERHPGFSKLFVHSERLEALNALVFTRRPRRHSDRPPVLVHSILCGDGAATPSGFETDRRAFLGRHGDHERPPGATGTLDGNVGWTLDPVMALRARLTLPPGARGQVDYITVAAGSRESALEIAERHATASALDWAVEDARRSAEIEARRLGIDSSGLAEAQALCRQLVYPRPPLNVLPTGSKPARAAQPHLWSMGLSGDLPVVLVRVIDDAHAQLLPAVVRAHQWWLRRGLHADLVILRDGASGYREPIRELLFAALREAGLHEGVGGFGGVHLLAADQVGGTERKTLETVARLSLDGAADSLANAVQTPRPPHIAPPRFQPIGSPSAMREPVKDLSRDPNGLFSNPLGSFTPDTGDYVIHLEPGRVTPAPWCNVLANEDFGTIVSEGGLGFTWCKNSGEHRLTPWSNDPLIDPQGEALYLRDEETARIWTPTTLPAGGGSASQIRHSPGSTTWSCNAEGLEQRLSVCVPADAPVKLAILTISNPGAHARRITVTYYAEWVLGALASVARQYLICGYDVQSSILTACNNWNPEFGDRTAFLGASRPPHSLTCDRAAFLGVQGDYVRPEGLAAWTLDGALDNIADPCAAFQVHIDLAPGAVEDVVFVLGEGNDAADAARLAAQWTDIDRARSALAANEAIWNKRLGAVVVSTPDPAFDLMVNRRLINQTFSSRVLARAGFHQAGGAIGFRDQLQDMMALLFTDPQRVRAHILDCAARQFEEGDVLHWWHPPTGRGVRTHCSDDLLWLVYATGRYVDATGDISILSEQIAFLSAPPLREDEEDRYALFVAGSEEATLFEHCRRAIDRGVTSGAHGLPLIGAGDWNDGMDRVGSDGRGESVWLAWFAAACADAFAKLALEAERSDLDAFWRSRADDLRRAADTAGWDGEWYVRAFADDGLPWGSKICDECQIDSISQSWSALADGPSHERTVRALAAATGRLVDPENRLVRLLAPPFDRTPRDPGYIRAYPPGVRENGGQYTHAAAWLGLAHARLGDGDRAYEIFDLINPIRRTTNLADTDLYRAEPYVLPADVRGADPGVGAAGWTWYTGAAGWAWQLAVEGILGVSLHRGDIRISPRLPKSWGRAMIRVNGPGGSLKITIEDPENLGSGRVEIAVDGIPVDGDCVALPSNGVTRNVAVRLRRPLAFSPP